MLLGSQEPQFLSVPDYVESAVGEVADLMALVGKPLDPYQRLVLEVWLGEQRDGSWAAFEAACFLQRQNGKGGLTEARELGGLFLFGEQLIIHTAHLVDTAKNAFERVVDLIDGCDELVRKVRNVVRSQGEYRIELTTGAACQFRTRSEGSGRGLTSDCLVLDEALYLKPGLLEDLVPTMAARPNAQMVYTSTAPKDAGAHIMKVQERGRAGAPRLAYAEWSNPAGVDLADPVVQARVNPAYGGRITPERMLDMRTVLGDEGFARECLGIWPDRDVGSYVIDLKVWAQWLDPDSVARGRVALALDSTPERSWSAIGMTGRRPGGLLHWQVLEHRPGMSWVVDRATELGCELANCGWFVDPTSPAGALIPDLRKAGLVVHEVAGRELTQACTAMLNAAVDGSGRHIGQAALDQAWRDARTVTSGDAERFGRKKSSGDITPLMVVTLSDHGFRVHGETRRHPPLFAWAGDGDD